MKGERRAVMSVSNLRVMEGWDHSAESAPKRKKKKNITWWGLRAQGEARLPKCGSHNKESRHETGPPQIQAEGFLPWSWVRLRTCNRLGFVGICRFPYVIYYCSFIMLIKPPPVQHSVEAQEERKGLCQEIRGSSNTGT